MHIAHADIGAAVHNRYVRGLAVDRIVLLHRLLAGYFLQKADLNADGSWEGNDCRAFTELPYHLVTVTTQILLLAKKNFSLVAREYRYSVIAKTNVSHVASGYRYSVSSQHMSAVTNEYRYTGYT